MTDEEKYELKEEIKTEIIKYLEDLLGCYVFESIADAIDRRIREGFRIL